MCIAVILVLNDIVKDFQKQCQMPMGVFTTVQEFGRGKQFEQIHEFDGRHQRHASPVGRYVAYDRQEAAIEGYQFVGPIDDQFVQRNGQQIVVTTTEQW